MHASSHPAIRTSTEASAARSRLAPRVTESRSDCSEAEALGAAQVADSHAQHAPIRLATCSAAEGGAGKGPVTIWQRSVQHIRGTLRGHLVNLEPKETTHSKPQQTLSEAKLREHLKVVACARLQDLRMCSSTRPQTKAAADQSACSEL